MRSAPRRLARRRALRDRRVAQGRTGTRSTRRARSGSATVTMTEMRGTAQRARHPRRTRLLARPGVRGSAGAAPRALRDARPGRRRTPVALLRYPVTLTDTPASIRSGPPRSGAHTREVLREVGYSDEAIDALLASGARRPTRADVPGVVALSCSSSWVRTQAMLPRSGMASSHPARRSSISSRVGDGAEDLDGHRRRRHVLHEHVADAVGRPMAPPARTSRRPRRCRRPTSPRSGRRRRRSTRRPNRIPRTRAAADRRRRTPRCPPNASLASIVATPHEPAYGRSLGHRDATSPRSEGSLLNGGCRRRPAGTSRSPRRRREASGR